MNRHQFNTANWPCQDYISKKHPVLVSFANLRATGRPQGGILDKHSQTGIIFYRRRPYPFSALTAVSRKKDAISSGLVLSSVESQMSAVLSSAPIYMYK